MFSYFWVIRNHNYVAVIQWNLDITNLYTEKSSVQTIFFTSVKKYEKEPRSNEASS